MAKKAIMTDAAFSDHPDFFGISLAGRIIFNALLPHTDTKGRVVIDPRWVKQKIFGWWPKCKLTWIRCALDELSDRHLIVPLTGVSCVSDEGSDAYLIAPSYALDSGLSWGQYSNFKSNNPRKVGPKGREGKGREGNTPPDPPAGGRRVGVIDRSPKSQIPEELETLAHKLTKLIRCPLSVAVEAVTTGGLSAENLDDWVSYFKLYKIDNPQVSTMAIFRTDVVEWPDRSTHPHHADPGPEPPESTESEAEGAAELDFEYDGERQP